MAKAKGEFARKIDPVIERVVEAYPSYFTKPEATRGVCKASPTLLNVMAQTKKQCPGWGIPQVILDAVENRLTQYLQQKVPSKYGVKVRKFENYAVGHGPRRWQKLEVMSLSELQVCVNWRRAHVAGEQAVIAAYEKIMDEMKKRKAARVGQVL